MLDVAAAVECVQRDPESSGANSADDPVLGREPDAVAVRRRPGRAPRAVAEHSPGLDVPVAGPKRLTTLITRKNHGRGIHGCVPGLHRARHRRGARRRVLRGSGVRRRRSRRRRCGPCWHRTRQVDRARAGHVRSQWAVGVAPVLDAQDDDFLQVVVDAVQQTVGAAARRPYAGEIVA